MATNTAPHDLSRRIDTVGWGLLLLMSGILFLIPGLPGGTWLVGLGFLVLSLNATKLAMGLPLDPFGVILGSGAILAGFGILAGIDVPVFASLLIVCGLGILAGQLRPGRTEG